MIIFDADDPLVLNGTYDREGYKPGERARIKKARARQLEGAQMDTEPITETPVDQPPPADAETIPSDSAPEPSIEERLQALPPIGDDVVTEVRCPQCTTKASWKGPITDDMIARTFTRGVWVTGLPNCPKCGTAMLRLDGVSAPDAIAAAAEQLGEDRVERPVHQPSIPGLRPAFNFQAAFESIIEQRRAVRAKEAIAEHDAKTAKKSSKAASDEQEELSKLEDDFEQRCQEMEFEQAERAQRATNPPCLYERLTGHPCPICRSAIAAKVDGERVEHLASAAVQDKTPLGNVALQTMLISLRRLVVPVEEIATWGAQDRLDLLSWLETPTVMTYPPVLGTPHEMGEAGCKNCGGLIAPFVPGADTWPVGQLVGTDCEPPVAAATPEPAPRPRKRHATTAARQSAKQQIKRTERAAGIRATKSKKRK